MMFSLGDRIRCQIDDKWWKGTVQKVEHHEGSKRSPFLSIFVHWDNNEKEYLSPWDLVSMLLNFFSSLSKLDCISLVKLFNLI